MINIFPGINAWAEKCLGGEMPEHRNAWVEKCFDGDGKTQIGICCFRGTFSPNYQPRASALGKNLTGFELPGLACIPIHKYPLL
jgi:hypothetical protein